MRNHELGPEDLVRSVWTQFVLALTSMPAASEGLVSSASSANLGVLPTQNHLFTSPPIFAEEADDTKPSLAAGIDVNASTNWVHTDLTKSSGPNS